MRTIYNFLTEYYCPKINYPTATAVAIFAGIFLFALLAAYTGHQA